MLQHIFMQLHAAVIQETIEEHKHFPYSLDLHEAIILEPRQKKKGKEK